MAVDDSFTKLLLHMDGADASTTFTDEAGNTVTPNGDAQIDTAQSKFGGASGLFDGTGDFLSIADSADWQLDGGSNSNTWTVDFWVRFNGDPSGTSQGFFQQRVDDGNGMNFVFGFGSGDNIRFGVESGGVTTVAIQNNWNPATGTWYHIALVKDGTNGYMMFIDGTQVGTTQTDTSTIPNFAAALQIGLATYSGANRLIKGWIDEFRISKGVARWTTNFTPPSEAYAPVTTTTNVGNFFPFF